MSKDREKKGLAGGMGLYYLLLLLVAGGAIIYGMIKIQWIDGKMWRAKAHQREEELQVQKAHRGNIYSSDGKILATTVPVCDLYLDLGRWQKKDGKGHPVTDSTKHVIIESLIPDSSYVQYLDQVCAILHEAVPSKPATWFRERIVNERSKDKPSRCYLIQRQIPYSSWVKICQLPGWKHAVVHNVDYKSIVRDQRAHTYGNLAGNVIGFRNSLVSETYTGLEGYYNNILGGKDGLYRCRRLTRGVWLPIEDGSKPGKEVNTDNAAVDNTIVRPVVDGKDIISTIDTRYQDIAETALRNALREFGGESGTAILMEMKTGYVLACSNLAIDTNAHDYLEVPNRNVAVSDMYEPGSTFKTVILTAMMNDPQMHIDTSMKLRVGFKRFPGAYGEIKDDHTLEGRDTLSLKQVIEQSSNVGMSELGWQFYRNRRDVLKRNVARMFPYQILKLDLKSGEYKGHINDVNASNRDFLNFCYGYSTNVSAMQLITFYNALGAGGRMVKPLFCRAIKDGNKEVPIEPVVLNEHMCSPHTAAIMKDLLIGVVEHGTGNNIKNNTYGIAGKTGTAVHSYKDLRRYNASFAGFFPTENPKYTCLVVVKDIRAYGRQSALVFKAIADCVMATDKELGNIKMDGGHWQLEEGRWVKKEGLPNTLPAIERGNQKEMIRIYQQLNLKYMTSDSSSLWAAFSPAIDSLGTPAHYVAYKPQRGVVPDCSGMTVKDAMQILQQCGYAVRFKGYGKVVKQSPRSGTKVAPKTTTVYLQLGI